MNARLKWLALGGYGLSMGLLALAFHMAASIQPDPKNWFCPSCDQIPVFLRWAGMALLAALVTSMTLIIAWIGRSKAREQRDDSAIQ